MDDIVLFREISTNDESVIGKKAVRIAELYNKGLPVPPGFVITGELFVKFIEISGLKDYISQELNSGQDVKTKSINIQKAIVNANVPSDMADFIYDNYTSLNIDDNSTNSMVESQQDPYVAIRVSSTSREVADVFFLNIKGKERLIGGIKACWASLFSETNIHLKRFKPALVVQKMINSKKSGYVFSVNPKTGNPNEIVVDISSGLGNGLSLEQVKPSRYTINKEEYGVLSSELVEQVVQYSLDFSQEKTVKLNLDEPIKNIIDDFILRELAKIGKNIESRFEGPQQIIFAIDKKIYVLGSKDLDVKPVSDPYQDATVPVQDPEDIAEQSISDDSFDDGSVSQYEAAQQPKPVESQQAAESDNSFGGFTDNKPEQESSFEKPDFIGQDNVSQDNASLEDDSDNVIEESYDDFIGGDEHIHEISDDEDLLDYEKTIEKSEDSLIHYDDEASSNQAKEANPYHNQEENSVSGVDMGSQTRLVDDNKQAPSSDKESFMAQYVNSKPEVAYQKAISFNSSMLVVACDMTILSALKNKYKSVFSKDAHNYFNELVNELKMRAAIPFENEIKDIHKLRDRFLNEFKELSTDEIAFVLEYTGKFLNDF
ncbi:MAG: PEP/pyruvate-binding domain-containing protein [Candidatus Woesearchaeota archaeon]